MSLMYITQKQQNRFSVEIVIPPTRTKKRARKKKELQSYVVIHYAYFDFFLHK